MFFKREGFKRKIKSKKIVEVFREIKKILNDCGRF
jgi:hypothetical protein